MTIAPCIAQPEGASVSIRLLTVGYGSWSPDPQMSEQPDTYLLGGADLEMRTIADLLAGEGAAVLDLGLAWGARLSDYAGDIEHLVAQGRRPVAIELTDDMPADWPPRQSLILIDHHGPRSGHDAPTALEQVFARLGLPPARWTRHFALVAANDRGHVAAMADMGACLEEMRAIRAADRAAQGVSAADEAEAADAVARRQSKGRLTRIDTQAASSTAVVDAMLPALGGPGFDRLLVVMPEKLAAYGDGPFITALARHVPGSWWGGDLPAQGYWGMGGTPESRAAALAYAERLG